MATLKKRFADYAASYYSDDDAVNQALRMKQEHTQRVCRNARMLANKLQVSEHDAALAETMALLHDVGRFKQFAVYQTFKDADSENHASLSVKEINAHRLLAGLAHEDAALVCEAISYHNAFAVPDHLSGRSRFFLRLLRDADKLDIWKVFGEYYENREAAKTESISLGLPDTQGCSPEALNAVRAGRLVRLQALENLHDFQLLQVSWIYDLNFVPTVVEMLEKGHMDRLQAALPRSREINEAFEAVFRYVGSVLSLAPDTMAVIK